MTVPQADPPAEIASLGAMLTGSTALLGTGLLPPARPWGRSYRRIAAFCRMLTATLYGVAAQGERNRMRQRFYGLDHRLIERFYSGETTMTDMLLLLTRQSRVLISAAPEGASA